MSAQAVAASDPTFTGQSRKGNSPPLFQKAWKFLPFSRSSPFHKNFACRALSLGSLILLSKVNRPPVQWQMNNKQREKKKKKILLPNQRFFLGMFNLKKKKKCKLCPKGDPAWSFLAAPLSAISPSHHHRHPISSCALTLMHTHTYRALRILAPDSFFFFTHAKTSSAPKSLLEFGLVWKCVCLHPMFIFFCFQVC